jgi:hypothetical protein
MTTICQNINTPISFTYVQGGPVIAGNIKLSNFSLTLGIGSSSSNLDLELVYDNCGGSNGITIPPIGRAVRFSCGQLSFGGIINSRTYSETSNGFSYKFKIIDPRKILENVSVMLKDYYCPLEAPNFINVASILERGVAVCPPGIDTQNWPRIGSCVNFARSGGDNGTNLVSALQAIQRTSTVYTTIGEPLTLNLGNVLAACPFYAVTEASSASLLSLISQACDEGACDFTVTLEGSTITVWTIDRTIQPSFGLIRQIIDTAQNNGTLLSGEIGEEELYENSNRVVVGEKVSYMTTVRTRPRASVTPTLMLGYDPAGEPNRAVGPNFRAYINISPLADSMGILANIALPREFPVEEQEILCAGSVELWKLYGTIQPNSLSALLQKKLGIAQNMKTVLQAFQRLQQAGNDQAASDLNTLNRSPRFAAKSPKAVLYNMAYEWFSSWISEWYGRKWLIPINSFCVYPAATSNVVSEGGSYYLSDFPVDAGWPNQANLLGLTYGIDTTIFESSDNKLSGFIVVPVSESISRNIYGKDIPFRLSPDGLSGDFFIKGNLAYIKIDTDAGRVYRNGRQAEVLITTPLIGMTPRLNENLLSFGLTALACLMDEGTLKNMEQRNIGYSDITSSNIYKMGFATAGFDFASIPMKSNVYVYGPWTSSAGAIGSTEVLQTNLSPWNYGNERVMNTVGQALAGNALRVANKTESGSMTLVEPPGYSIQYFLSAGVVINSINVNYNSGGATTSYNFQSYSSKFGQYGKALSDNVQKSMKARNEIFTFAKEQRRRTLALVNSMRSSFSKSTSINAFDNRSNLNTASPGNVLVGGYHSNIGVDNEINVIEIGLNSKKEYETSIQGDNFQKLAIMSLDGLFTPVSIKGRGGSLPRYMVNFKYERGNLSRKTRPSMPPLNNEQNDEANAFPINQTFLNPILSASMLSEWQNRVIAPNSTTIQVLGFGTNTVDEDIYGGDIKNKYDNETDFGFYSLRGPLVLQAWGYDTENKPIPNWVDNPNKAAVGEFEHENLKDRFMYHWLSKPETWPVGPVDLRFDRDRGVWVCPPPDRILLAKLDGELKAEGCATAYLVNNTLMPPDCEPGNADPSFHSNYNVWGSFGESIMDNIEDQYITVYNFLDKVTIPSGELIYAVYNDDKYLAIPKGGGSVIKIAKYTGEWGKDQAKTVNAYKVKDVDGVDHKTNPQKANLEGDAEYEPVKALNLLRKVKPKDGSETWCVIADIGLSFHIVIGFGGNCDDSMDAGLIASEFDAESALKDITMGDSVEVLVNENGCAKWWKVNKEEMIYEAALGDNGLEFKKKKVHIFVEGQDAESDIIEVATCDEANSGIPPSGSP